MQQGPEKPDMSIHNFPIVGTVVVYILQYAV